ncbi:MAG: DUF4249 family protein, partial [Saprospiraceae bacterium]
MRHQHILYTVFFFVIFLTACEEEYIPAKSPDGPKYVVEGFIEAGENPFPTYVILTKTFDFYSEIGPDQFTEAFVHDADVRVDDGAKEIVLEEVCFLDLPEEIRKQVAGQFGFDADSLEINFCVYVDFLNQIQPQIGGQYDLKIVAEGHQITATTMIPEHVPFNEIYFAPPPGQPNDSLAQLRTSISDPQGRRNFYR